MPNVTARKCLKNNPGIPGLFEVLIYIQHLFYCFFTVVSILSFLPQIIFPSVCCFISISLKSFMISSPYFLFTCISVELSDAYLSRWMRQNFLSVILLSTFFSRVSKPHSFEYFRTINPIYRQTSTEPLTIVSLNLSLKGSSNSSSLRIWSISADLAKA